MCRHFHCDLQTNLFLAGNFMISSHVKMDNNGVRFVRYTPRYIAFVPILPKELLIDTARIQLGCNMAPENHTYFIRKLKQRD